MAGVFPARSGRDGAGVAVGAATDAVDVVAPYINGADEVTSASPRRANTRQALPTAPDDRFNTRAMSPGVRPMRASASTRATIARNSPLRNRGADPPGEVDAVAGVAVPGDFAFIVFPFRSLGMARAGLAIRCYFPFPACN
ncbi:hypothetical protein ACFV4N_15480 [Actinosynnema sp. NPDC059797]